VRIECPLCHPERDVSIEVISRVQEQLVEEAPVPGVWLSEAGQARLRFPRTLYGLKLGVCKHFGVGANLNQD